MLLIILIAVLSVSSKIDAYRSKSPIPLNFFEAIENLNYKLNNKQTLLSESQLDLIQRLGSNKDEFIINLLEKLTSQYFSENNITKFNLPNVTTECSLQLVHWFLSVSSKPPQMWALSGKIKMILFEST